ncbi:hypothetical protein AMTRI_Chr09g13230 [Amborella trichopoda]
MAAPTGCYKCGLPGHWSRDCSSSSSNPAISTDQRNPNPNIKPWQKTSQLSANSNPSFKQKSPQTVKKAPRQRPKLTEELLLSEDGLGYVLQHFPRAMKIKGPGQEVRDLGNLIELYALWHSRLLPYFSFDQFVKRVEKVGATKRVRMCIRELKERVARGGDPSKLYELPVEPADQNNPPEDIEDSVPDLVEPPVENHEVDVINEEMFDEIYKQAVEEPPCQTSPHSDATINPSIESSEAGNVTQVKAPPCNTQNKFQVTEEQRARMEANRLKALERAASRKSQLSQAQ